MLSSGSSKAVFNLATTPSFLVASINSGSQQLHTGSATISQTATFAMFPIQSKQRARSTLYVPKSKRICKMDSMNDSRVRREFPLWAIAARIIGKSLQLNYSLDTMNNSSVTSYTVMTSFLFEAIQGLRNLVVPRAKDKYGDPIPQYSYYDSYLKRVPRINFSFEQDNEIPRPIFDDFDMSDATGEKENSDEDVLMDDNIFDVHSESDRNRNCDDFLRFNQNGNSFSKNKSTPPKDSFIDLEYLEIENRGLCLAEDFPELFGPKISRSENMNHESSSRSESGCVSGNTGNDVNGQDACLSKRKPDQFNLKPFISFSLTKEQLLKHANPAALSAFLQRLELKHRISEYREKPHRLESDEIFCKNLLLKDRKGEFYYLICSEDKTTDLKRAAKLLGANRNLSFASIEETDAILHLEKGGITPFALMHDTAANVHVAMTTDLIQDETALLNFHPFDSNLTLSLTLKSLEKYLSVFKHSLDFLPL